MPVQTSVQVSSSRNLQSPISLIAASPPPRLPTPIIRATVTIVASYSSADQHKRAHRGKISPRLCGAQALYQVAMVERDSRESSPEEGELEKDEFTPPPSSLRHRDNPTSAKSHQDGDRSIERSRRRAGLDPYDDERPGVVLPRKRPRDQYDSPSDLPKPHETFNDSENRANPSEHSPKRKMQPYRPHSPLARAIPSSPRRSPARPSQSVQNGEAPHPAAATASLHEDVPSIAAKDEPLTEEELARMEWPPLSEGFASRLAEAWSKEMDICRGAVFNHGESAVARRADGRKLHKSTNVRKWLGCSSIDSYDVSVQLGEGTFG
jgi:hypothetical protein